MEAADRAERFYRAQGLPTKAFDALRCKAELWAGAGEWQLARDLLPVLQRLEDPAWPAWRRSKRLGLQATIHLAQGQPEAALALYREQRAMLLMLMLAQALCGRISEAHHTLEAAMPS